MYKCVLTSREKKMAIYKKSKTEVDNVLFFNICKKNIIITSSTALQF